MNSKVRLDILNFLLTNLQRNLLSKVSRVAFCKAPKKQYLKILEVKPYPFSPEFLENHKINLAKMYTLIGLCAVSRVRFSHLIVTYFRDNLFSRFYGNIYGSNNVQRFNFTGGDRKPYKLVNKWPKVMKYREDWRSMEDLCNVLWD